MSKNYGLKYGGEDKNLTLSSLCDASFGANVKGEDQRSSYGWLFTLGGAAVSWTAKRHENTSMSTAEAEMMSAKEAFTQAIHLRSVLIDLGTPQPEATNVHIDSQAAYQAALGEYFSKRLKHVNADLQWVRERLEKKIVRLVLVRSENQSADFLTKPVSKVALKRHLKTIGINN